MTVIRRRVAVIEPITVMQAKTNAHLANAANLAQARAKLNGLDPATASAPAPRARGEAPKMPDGPDIGIVSASSSKVTVTVLGRPAPQGSKISNRFGGMREANPRTKPWREAIESVCKHPSFGVPSDFVLFDGPLSVDVWCFFEPPKNAKQGDYPSTKSTYDVDKLARAVNDGITGLIIVDDARIVDLNVHKRYVWDGAHERAEVTVSKMSS